MKKGSLDDSVFYSPPATKLPLWEVEPQSVASGGSPDGAEKSKGAQREQSDAVLTTLASYGAFAGTDRYLSHDMLVMLTDIPATTLCARLGPSGQLLTMKQIIAKPGACMSKAGVRVIGYQLARRKHEAAA